MRLSDKSVENSLFSIIGSETGSDFNLIGDT